MITLTTPVPVPNMTRIRVTNVQIDDVHAVAAVQVTALGPPGNRVYGVYSLQIVDAQPSQGVTVNPSSTSYSDALSVVALTIAAGFTNVEAAYRTGGNRAAAFRAVEAQGLTDGWIAASLTGPIS